MSKQEWTHIDQAGRACMVDVSEKEESRREALAVATLWLQEATLDRIEGGQVAKGEVLGAARIAGIMAAKRTSALIPLCHPLSLTHVEVDLAPSRQEGQARIDIRARVRSRGPTGVEMEALTAASIAALTVYDMCKAIDREMVIGEIYLAYKQGGKSGPFTHPRRRGDAPVL